MTAMSVREFNANVSRAIAMVEAGETVDITKNGKVVAELRPKQVRSAEWQAAYDDMVAFMNKGCRWGLAESIPPTNMTTACVSFAVDSNLLVYAIDIDTPRKHAVAIDVMSRGAERGLVLPAQVLGEFLAVVCRKFPAFTEDAATQARHWSIVHEPVRTGPEHLLAAVGWVQRYRLQFWDSVILAVATSAGARIMLSEDMQDGFTIDGMTVLNPFLAANGERVSALLSG